MSTCFTKVWDVRRVLHSIATVICTSRLRCAGGAVSFVFRRTEAKQSWSSLGSISSDLLSAQAARWRWYRSTQFTVWRHRLRERYCLNSSYATYLVNPENDVNHLQMISRINKIYRMC